MGIEELTQEELVNWIRENVQGIDEKEVVTQILYERRDNYWERCSAASKKGAEINDQIINLIQPYVDGPIKHGVRLKKYPISVQQEYKKLDQERAAAWNEWKTWFEKYKEASDRIFSFHTSLFNEFYEKFYD